jgi:hypothetical protein
MRTRDTKLAAIKARFSRELRELKKLQEVESRDLFPPTDVSGADLLVQARPDLNQAIAFALASHAVPASLADCLFSRGSMDGQNIETIRSEYPFLRGYGDDQYNTLQYNTFTWSGPSGVRDCTGQRPEGPPAG